LWEVEEDFLFVALNKQKMVLEEGVLMMMVIVVIMVVIMLALSAFCCQLSSLLFLGASGLVVKNSLCCRS
jgi:type IV secretory pathway VirB3-like protein